MSAAPTPAPSVAPSVAEIMRAIDHLAELSRELIKANPNADQRTRALADLERRHTNARLQLSGRKGKPMRINNNSGLF